MIPQRKPRFLFCSPDRGMAGDEHAQVALCLLSLFSIWLIESKALIVISRMVAGDGRRSAKRVRGKFVDSGS